ncbi:MAG TPA: hypothetical protein VFY10_13020 [Dehalococcoidia bacterium]|nr:hypothetical protein [Dehalococcoidia bacterium]
MKRAPIILSILAATAIVEALLGFRLWVQITAQPIEGQSSLSVMSLSRGLSLPFGYVTGSAPITGTGVIDFTLLTAMEGYFLAMLGALFLTFAFGRTSGWLAAHRSPALPRFVVQERSNRNRRPALQLVHSSRRDGVRFYTRVDARTAIVPESAGVAVKEDDALTWT